MPEPPSKYTWNAASGRYHSNRTGRYVTQQTITRAVERQVQQARDNMRGLSVALQNGEIDLATWRLEMLDQIKTAHVASAVAARGGWSQMTPSDWGRTGQTLREQYKRLNVFASELQYGKQKPDGRFLQRADMYGSAGRSTYQNEVRALKEDAGYTEGRRVLRPGDSCTDSASRPGCIELAAQGWVPIAEMVPIGDATCLVNCRCGEEFR